MRLGSESATEGMSLFGPNMEHAGLLSPHRPPLSSRQAHAQKATLQPPSATEAAAHLRRLSRRGLTGA
eukprot:1184279-Prorocentrum_minimum.AAC.3